MRTGRFGTDTASYRQLLKVARQWPERVWAVEGANGIGRPIAQRLLAEGEHVLDVPAKLAAQARVFDTGQGVRAMPPDGPTTAQVRRGQGIPGRVAVPETSPVRRGLPPARRGRIGTSLGAGGGPGALGTRLHSGVTDLICRTSVLRISHSPNPHP
jgi:hypothetical protein